MVRLIRELTTVTPDRKPSVGESSSIVELRMGKTLDLRAALLFKALAKEADE